LREKEKGKKKEKNPGAHKLLLCKWSKRSNMAAA
jgi:hypothetical protein